MGLRCGIVGLPNVGKSTLFNALTAAGVAAENYAFCTVEPNAGVVPVPDPRLDAIARVVRPGRVVPATVEFVDIAGLVRGASKGEGLGNQFLAHIRETHAILHVVRCFEDDEVAHVEGGVDPARDIATVETELALADLQTIERRLDRARRAAKSGAKAPRQEALFLAPLLDHISAGSPARSFVVEPELQPIFRDCHLLTAKPVLYVANVDEELFRTGGPWVDAVEHHAAGVGARAIRLCGKIEAELTELSDDEKGVFLADLGLEEPGLHRLVHEAYALLGLVTFFTTGDKEVRAWTVREGTHAPQAAGEVHTDFERHFIRAEVVPFEQFVEAGGEVGAKERGWRHVEGKDYPVRDGDVIHFRVGV
jgi:GTP-binding protein YchF